VVSGLTFVKIEICARKNPGLCMEICVTSLTHSGTKSRAIMTEGNYALSPTKRVLLALKDLQSRLDAAEAARTEPIAIIGMGCRFPGGATDPERFWNLLRDGTDAITEVPAQRWDADAFYNPDPDAPGTMCTRHGGFLEQHDWFDAQFFGISPREAARMDPQHRLMLEVAWEALEDAGQLRDRSAGSRVGVFIGITANEHAHLQMAAGGAEEVDAYHITGNALNTAAGRLAFVLGFRGPCMAIDTACSSSLVAVHQACASLRIGECEMALAGGVNLILSPIGSIALTKARVLSPSGRCRAFDNAADGIVRGEGCGVIVLKRLSAALAAGDCIHAVIRGSAVNHDGASSGLTVPNGPAQEAVIRQALAAARLQPSEVSLVEAHGTGTPLGDPIEVEALGAVYGEGRPPGDPLRLGSLKTNIGHTEASAGIAGLIKLALALRHEIIPPHLHFDAPSRHIRWSKLPLAVVTRATPWPRGERARIAAISSFGFSGTNAHVLVAEAPPAAAPVECPAGAQVLALSAKSAPALRALAERFQSFLSARREVPLGDICFSANTGRLHFAHRLAAVAAGAGEMAQNLGAFLAGATAPGLFFGKTDAPAGDGTCEIAARYAAGGTTDWAALYRDRPSRRVALPTYPFQRERFGLDFTGFAPPARAEHALLGRRLRLADTEEVRFAAELKADAFLRDHRVFGAVVVPATALAEMALAAGASIGRGGVALTDFVIEQALTLPESGRREVQTLLAPSGAVRIFSSDGAGEWTLHASGTVCREDGEPPAPAIDFQAIAARCTEQCDPAALYERYRERGVEYGPAFRGLESVRRAPGAAVGRIAAPGAATGFCLHPALLDSAFQLLGAAFPDDAADSGDSFLPVGFESLRIFRAGCVAGSAAIEVRPVAAEKFVADLLLVDKHGGAIAELRGLAIKRARRESLLRAAAPDRILYEIAWRARDRAAVPAESAAAWLLAGPACELAERLKERIAARGERCVEAPLGCALPLRAVFFACGDGAADTPLTSLPPTCGSLLHLVQALTESAPSAGIRLSVVTRGAVPAGGAVDPAQSAVWALGAVVANEHPELGCRRIDLDPQATAADALDELIGELIAPDAEDQIAWRGGQRHAARLAPWAPAGSAAAVTPGGSYLITGGLGALGLQVAAWLAGRGAQALVLAGRRPPSEAAHGRLREIEEKGTRVHVVQTDVAEPAGAAAALAAAAASGLPLRGIVHAAGVLDDGVLAQQRWERFERVLAPKAAGAWNLHLLTRSQPLDFFVCFSSAAAVFGTPGQGNYAAANGFLDGLAHLRRAQGLPALSINWGPWADAGMAAASGARYESRGIGMLASAQALGALETLLDGGAAQAAVLPVKWPVFAKQFAGRAAPPLFEECLPRDAARPAKATFHGLADCAPEERPELVAAYLREQAAAVLRLAPEQVEPGQPLSAFGLDSLMAIELRNRVKSDLDVELALVSFLDGASLERLASEIAGKLAAPRAANDHPADPLPAADITAEDASRLLADLDGLSDEQVEELLGAGLPAGHGQR
jgi:acyl transferase domain-containing protein/acyl carrier protein